MMPEQKPGRSVQSVQTPPDFMSAVIERFGPISFDLAADVCNRQAANYFSEIDDSLVQDWEALNGNLWLNPPFKNIDKWAAKCASHKSKTSAIFMLVPASVGSNWFARHVFGKSYVLALNPRLVFVGHYSVYPKDLILCCYGLGFRGFDIWRWKV